jgi:hypothetical protein
MPRFSPAKLLNPSGIKEVDLDHSEKCRRQRRAERRYGQQIGCICGSKKKRQKILNQLINLQDHPLWKGSKITNTGKRLIFSHPNGAIAKIYIPPEMQTEKGTKTMINLKKKITTDKCAAMRCTQAPVEIHHLDEDLPFCEKHAETVAKEYEGEEVEITKLGAVVKEESSQPEELQAEHEEFKSALEMVQEFQIQNQDDVAFAEESRAETKGEWKRYETKRTKATKKFNEGLREVNSWFKPVQATLKAMETEWNRKLKEYRLEQNRKQAELIEKAQEAEEPEEVRETLVAASEATMKTSEVTFVDRWVFEIVDPEAVPREFLCPDEAKIGGVVAAMKDKTDIPGVRAWNDPIVRGPSR